MRRMPIPCRRSFQPRPMPDTVLCGIRPSFPGLFPGRGQVAYVLLTSAPVAISGVATAMLPLDLHVLSLSLAFILSQDQTLRCCYLVFFPFQESLKDNALLARRGHTPECVDDPPQAPLTFLLCSPDVFRNLDVTRTRTVTFTFLVSPCTCQRFPSLQTCQ